MSRHMEHAWIDLKCTAKDSTESHACEVGLPAQGLLTARPPGQHQEDAARAIAKESCVKSFTLERGALESCAKLWEPFFRGAPQTE